MSLAAVRFNTIEVLTYACCIYRERGYTSTSAYVLSENEGRITHTNKDMLTYQLLPMLAPHTYLNKFEPIIDDVYQAERIIKHFRKLSFGVMGDSLNDYMARVYTATQLDDVSMKDFGILSSVPQVYDKEIAEKLIREEIKSTVNGYLAKEGDEIELNIRYISTKMVEKVSCYSHQAVTDGKYLVSFLSKHRLGVAGMTQTIRAKVKKHTVNYTTKTPETQLNYVKVVDNEFVWQ